jgi:hypothetical protein
MWLYSHDRADTKNIIYITTAVYISASPRSYLYYLMARVNPVPLIIATSQLELLDCWTCEGASKHIYKLVIWHLQV